MPLYSSDTEGSVNGIVIFLNVYSVGRKKRSKISFDRWRKSVARQGMCQYH
jgi:hypothetical protein